MRTLLFGTTYVDTLEKRAVQSMWFKMAEKNPECDTLIVDSCSPLLPHVPSSVWYYGFEDNVGHLSRGGRDGWGRAFCYGLNYAVEGGYDWVVHIECDSLCRLPIVELPVRSNSVVETIPVSSMLEWPETGFMVMSVDWLHATHFIERYDWENRTKYPEPERVVKTLVGNDLTYMPCNGMRDDFKVLTVDNVLDKNLDWLTHASLPVMEKFACA